ncbi:MAG: nickel insertion protein [Eubacteriales bacterium]
MSSKLILAQVDHSTGEVIGHCFEKLFQIGVQNVQVLQSITKKNRPGYMLYIDLKEEIVEEVAIFLGMELGIWGYHILESQHVHFDVSFQQKTLYITDGVHTVNYIIKAKVIKNNDQLFKIKIDHDQLVEIQKKLLSFGCNYSLDALRAGIESRLREDAAVENITIAAKPTQHGWGTIHFT